MERFERAMGMTARQWNDNMTERKSFCRCKECPTFLRAIDESQTRYKSLGWDLSKESRESNLGLQFCHSGKSSRISEERSCLCRDCQVAREMFITHSHYCIYGDAPTRLGALTGMFEDF